MLKSFLFSPFIYNFAAFLSINAGMKYAIIAAGEGSRLAQEGVQAPKPLVRVNGEQLIDRLIRIFMDNNATEIIVICNDVMKAVGEHLAELERDGLNGCRVPLRYIVKSTPSSMHSFFEISRFLGDGPFVLTTVDTIFREDDFRRYVAAFEQSEADGMMGVTDYIDDEKPLYVGVEAGENNALNDAEYQHITGFFDTKEEVLLNNRPSIPGTLYISGGIYGLRPSAIQTLNRCMENGESRMRNFQRGLIRDGLELEAFPFTKVLDIDHASDIAKAEAFLKIGN